MNHTWNTATTETKHTGTSYKRQNRKTNRARKVYLQLRISLQEEGKKKHNRTMCQSIANRTKQETKNRKEKEKKNLLCADCIERGRWRRLRQDSIFVFYYFGAYSNSQFKESLFFLFSGHT